MTPWSVAARAGLAVLSGLLYVAAYPGTGLGLWPLAFVAYGPLYLATRGLAPRPALALGWLAGATSCLLGFRFLLDVLVRFSGFPAPLCWLLLLGFAALSAGRMAAHAGLSAWLSGRGVRSELAFVAAFAIAEAWFPVAFEWSFAAAVADVPLLVQTAELWGAVPIGALLVGCGAVAGDALSPNGPRRRAPLIVACAVTAATCAYGAVRLRAVDALARAAPGVRIGIVQGNAPLDADEQETERALAGQRSLHHDVVRQGAELVVWAEGAYPHLVSADAGTLALTAPPEHATEPPAIVGAIVADGERVHNAAIVVEGGRVAGRYDKQILLPFSEYLPLAEQLPWLRELSPASGAFTPGRHPGPVRVTNRNVAVVICYEDVLAAQVRRSSDGRAELLVNLTNDAWFGSSGEPEVHLALARFRAIEQRKYLVRATNSGVSALVDPAGRVVAALPSSAPASRVVEARWLAGRSIYDRAAPLLPAASLLGLVALSILGRRGSGGPSRVRHGDQSGG